MCRIFIALVIAATLFTFTACNNEDPASPEVSSYHKAPSLTKVGDYSGHTVVLGLAETITDPESGEPGGVEWFRQDLGNGQLSDDFVYGDPRRATLINGGKAGITFGVKTGNTSGDVNLTDQIGWLYQSIDVWDREDCADMTLSENDVDPDNIGLIEKFFKGGGIDISVVEADMTQIGFRSAADFPYFADNPNVLGVTFTLFWADEDGSLTDIDGNGKIDVALREIYYNDEFEWADNGFEGPQPNGPRVFDFPSVAIHEVGHGFSSAHFGNIGIKDGFLFAKPHTVMNAVYGGILRDLTGQDRSGHCANWAQWPNN